ncbi:hypothetical protein ACFL3S_11625, partial [Gemmatimonadota bacterium]
QVPDLPTRRVAASGHVVVKFQGSILEYEPGRGSTASRFLVSPGMGMPRGVSAQRPPKSIVVRDTSVALLSAEGEVFTAGCWMGERLLESRQVALQCEPWVPLSRPSSPIAAIEFLREGQLLGVGAGGLAVTWRGGEPGTEALPAAASGDSLWAVASLDGGATTVFGKRTVLQREKDGTWSVVRRSPRVWREDHRFAVLGNGDLVVADEAIQVWDRSSDSLPMMTLRQSVVGAPKVADLQVLPDGRLVAGFSVPNEPSLGGWLQVWTPPFRPEGFERVDFPRTIDITDIASDGVYLYVVGRGGGVTIAIDSLPVGSRARPN